MSTADGALVQPTTAQDSSSTSVVIISSSTTEISHGSNVAERKRTGWIPTVSSAPELSSFCDAAAAATSAGFSQADVCTAGACSTADNAHDQRAPASPKRKRKKRSSLGPHHSSAASSHKQEHSPVETMGQKLNATSAASTSKKRRRRRGRKWKPYSKMTWQERRELEKREEKRAECVRAERFAHGIPVAPYNTTQFLLEDRQARSDHYRRDDEVDSIVENIRAGVITNGHPTGSSESGGDVSDSSGGDSEFENEEEKFLEKEFSQEYQTMQTERLQAMSKSELIQDYLQLEETMLRDVREKQTVNEALSDRIVTLEKELELVKLERDQLREKCEQLLQK